VKSANPVAPQRGSVCVLARMAAVAEQRLEALHVIEPPEVGGPPSAA
jgi:hypothetical protein